MYIQRVYEKAWYIDPPIYLPIYRMYVGNVEYLEMRVSTGRARGSRDRYTRSSGARGKFAAERPQSQVRTPYSAITSNFPTTLRRRAPGVDSPLSGRSAPDYDSRGDEQNCAKAHVPTPFDPRWIEEGDNTSAGEVRECMERRY